MNLLLCAVLFFSSPTHNDLYDRAVSVYNLAVRESDVQGYSNAQNLLEEYVSLMGQDARPMAYLLIGECERGRDRHCHSLSSYEWAFGRGSNYVKHHAGVNLAYACLRCDEIWRAKEIVDYLLSRKDIREMHGAEEDITCCAAYVYRHASRQSWKDTYLNRAAEQLEFAVSLRPTWPNFACDLAEMYMKLAGITDAYETAEGARWADEYRRKAWTLLTQPRYMKWKKGRIQKLRDGIEEQL